jgi:gluconate kinase
MKEIIILFGEMGSGKNYHGEKLAKEKGYLFFDGDDALTSEMRDRVNKFKPISREMILHFISDLLSVIIEKSNDTDTGLVVSQALYFDEDRTFIEYVLRRMGFTVNFKWVKVPFVQNFKQIYSRPKGFRWALYWLMSKPWFQEPSHEYSEI